MKEIKYPITLSFITAFANFNGYKNFDWQFHPSTLMSSHCLLSFMFLMRSQLNTIRSPLYMTIQFSHATFKIFCLFLSIVLLWCLWVWVSLVYLLQIGLICWVYRLMFFTKCSSFPTIIYLNIFFCSFLSPLFFGTSIMLIH